MPTCCTILDPIFLIFIGSLASVLPTGVSRSSIEWALRLAFCAIVFVRSALLAFTTGATVGFGDLVPFTSASRIFSVFIVSLGYALFSVVTASIAALFAGEDEKRLKREFHSDIRSLRADIAALRMELHRVSGEPHKISEND